MQTHMYKVTSGKTAYRVWHLPGAGILVKAFKGHQDLRTSKKIFKPQEIAIKSFLFPLTQISSISFTLFIVPFFSRLGPALVDSSFEVLGDNNTYTYTYFPNIYTCISFLCYQLLDLILTSKPGNTIWTSYIHGFFSRSLLNLNQMVSRSGLI